MINYLLSLSRINKQLIILVVDYVLLVLMLLGSFSIRLDYWYFPTNAQFLVVFGLPIIALPIFAFFDMYRVIIRYIEIKSLLIIIRGVSFYALLWGLFCIMMEIKGIPRSVILINWMLSILAIGGVRFFARSLLSIKNHNNRKQILVYGAGEAGIQLISALTQSKDYNIVGIVDDRIELQGRNINGIKVYPESEVKALIYSFKLDEVLIAMPSASRKRRLAIIEKLEPFPVHVRILPDLTNLTSNEVNISDLREVNIKDLLERESVIANKDLLGKNITNKVVLVTGAGGSIGSELCKQIIFLKPKALILYERSELALYNIEKNLPSIGIDSINIYPILGSVISKNRLASVFNCFAVDTIYHTAAYKHVPMVEFNVSEGVENNIFGTLNCAQVAIDCGVKTFVLISTDKAVRPTNTMGATKRSAELVLQALSCMQGETTFSIVRFGNVLGSSGSVIPLFKQQIKEGGPITVTDKDIIRYFMTIPEAVELVIQAGAMGKGGDVFVLNMGKPVSIKDLAHKMIRLSGLKIKDEFHPNGDIEIIYTGLRPGEKLYEELLIGDKVSSTENPLIMSAQEEMIDWDELKPVLDAMINAIESCEQEKLRKLLIQIVPGFQPQSEISDILHNNH